MGAQPLPPCRRCDALKLAMIKNRHLARRLFGGDVYDCVCRYDSSAFSTEAS